MFSILILQIFFFFFFYIRTYELFGKFNINLGIVSDELKLQFSTTKQLIKEILLRVLWENSRKISVL